MRYLKLLFWLLAWGVWVWLGFGLHRELPRDLGPKVCDLTVQLSNNYEFVKDTHLVAVHRVNYSHPLKVRVYNADNGEFVREVSFGDHYWNSVQRTIRSHGVMVATKSRGLRVVDLQTGEWKQLSEMMAVNVAVHQSKPWIAFRESAPPIDKPRPFVVVDWTTGAEVFARPPDKQYVHIGPPIFLGDTDRLVVPVGRPAPDPPFDGPMELEIWRLGPPARLEKTIRAPTIPRHTDSASASRIAWRSPGPETMYLDVFDVDAERLVFSLPQREERITSGLVHSRDEGFLFSKTGRTILGGVPVGVWDVDTGAKLWERADGFPHVLENEGAFAVVESWDIPWMPLALRRWLLRSNTIAVYDLDSAERRFRSWYESSDGYLARSGDGALGIDNRGAVHRLPHRVNWPLLALCQLLLATPIVLVWIVLRWRQRRAAHRQLPGEPGA